VRSQIGRGTAAGGERARMTRTGEFIVTATGRATTPSTHSADRPAAAHEILRDMTTGWVLPHGLQVVADLGVADALDDEPRGHTFMTDTHCDVPSGLPT